MEHLPCVCHFATDVIGGVKTFLFEPCSESCLVYRFVLEQSESQGKPVDVIDLR